MREKMIRPPVRQPTSAWTRWGSLWALAVMAASGCAQTYMLGADFGAMVPIVGSGEIAASPISGTFEAHGGTTGLFESQQLTDLGVGLGLSQRIRMWRGVTGSIEVGPHVFHLSHRHGNFGWFSRVGLLLGLVDRDNAVRGLVFAGQAASQAMYFLSNKGVARQMYVSLGAVVDATTSPPDGGSALSIGGVLGVGLAWRGRE